MTTEGKGELAAYADRVSHDLKNPLSAIRMSLELAREELGDVEPSVRELLDRAERNVARLQRMLDELEATARGESGSGPDCG